MGLLSNPLRSRESHLPVYQNINTPTKEAYSDDEYYYSDEETEASSAGHSRSSSRSASTSSILAVKRQYPRRSIWSRLYPYRMPSRLTRYLCLIMVGTIVLMIVSLVRASQVENWKLANGKTPERPAPPAVWERFPFLERYYGGIRTLQPVDSNEPEYPKLDEGTTQSPSAAATEIQSKDVPESSSWGEYKNKHSESVLEECFLDAAKNIRVPQLRYYQGRPQGFPQHVGGSYDLLKLPEDICFERFGRYGPYGFGYSTRKGGLGIGEHSESEGSASVWDQVPYVDYREVDWADAQRRCFQANSRRFKSVPEKPPSKLGFYISGNSPSSELKARSTNAIQSNNGTNQAHQTNSDKQAIQPISRTALVIRCWDEFFFREEDIVNLRSMISELSLTSGGRYDIHLLVQVKNDGKYPIWADNDAYNKRIEESIPKEFRGMVTMWTVTQMLSLYQGIHDVWTRGPDLPVHGAYRGLPMAMQHFAYMHPEYDFYWQWEMDVRYTGHYHDLLSKVEEWAKAQPRKGLWERNARYYVPAAHGTWEDFSQMARVQSQMSTSNNPLKHIPGMHEETPESVTKDSKTVWGPVRPEDESDWFEHENDPQPPTTYERDHYQWGVGEEADYITFNPIFNPEGTTWLLKDDITGYNSSHPLPPRRASIITTSRMSRRLLMSMHRMTAYKKQFAFPEMWPATVALQHGYKAVYVPHPLFVDRKWPVDFLAKTLNGGHNGATGGSRTSVYGEREHNLRGLTWFYNSGFGPNMYKRWLGLRVNNDGGDEFEREVDESKQGSGVDNMKGGEGRMCLPPMLLHPIKDVDMPVETPQEEEQAIPESDPAA